MSNDVRIAVSADEHGAGAPGRAQARLGGQTTGLTLVGELPVQGRVVRWAANLHHRDQRVRATLNARRGFRRVRRATNTRYRLPCFNNCIRLADWLPPSLLSRVGIVHTRAERLLSRAPLASIAVEPVRAGTPAIENPEITGAGYPPGTFANCAVRASARNRAAGSAAPTAAPRACCWRSARHPALARRVQPLSVDD